MIRHSSRIATHNIRRDFTGGSDARIIIGHDEIMTAVKTRVKHPPLASHCTHASVLPERFDAAVGRA
jgi:hypothetical protein